MTQQAFLGNVPAVAEASGGRSGTEDAVQLSITYKHDTHVGNGNIIAKSKVRRSECRAHLLQYLIVHIGYGKKSPTRRFLDDMSPVMCSTSYGLPVQRA